MAITPMAKLQMVPMRNGDLPQWKPPQNTKHAASVISELGRNMHEHAYLVGRTLLWVKKEVGHGKFLPWLEKNVWFGATTASHMMRFAQECTESGSLAEYHHGKKKLKFSESENLPSPKRKPEKQSEADEELADSPGPFSPATQCYFDVAHRIDLTYDDLDQEEKTELLTMLRALLDNLEKGDVIKL